MDFQSRYDRNEFLKFLRNDFLWEKFEEHVEQTSITKEFKSSFFTSITKLWVVEEFDNLIVLEIEHKSKNDARISLTKDIFKLLRQFELEWLLRQNALVILKNSDTEQYRFSLLTTTYNEDFEEKLSNPKRYSFLLGKWEKTKTPTEYLISKWKVDSLEVLIKRFDVEVVRKEFFNDYLNLYIRLYKAIIDDKDFVLLLKTQKVEIVSFTKNLLWKIVFLYFIQKKGWLWVKSDWEYWKDWDKNFMRSFWNSFKSDKKTVWENTGFFYNDYLEHLFYEWLNKDNRDDNDLSDYFDFKVPYLNGWLFKKDYEKWNKNESKIINDIFSNKTDTFEWNWILDIFDTYNFTIDEDDLYDSDIAIDPEMLGRIFEKMISISEDNIDEILAIYESKNKLEIWNELNKKFGAFYTPREIVHYMTKESIISYLVNNLPWKRDEKEKQIRTLFDVKEKFLLNETEFKDNKLSEEIFNQIWGIIEEIDILLKKVKILDPAIGSGAFPMWILHEISTIRYYIYWVFFYHFKINFDEFKNDDSRVSMYKIKRDIIKNSIFWVDISSGAIDIARLRFWLSLVVDEEKPEPLPNFEFKFVCANTLIPLEEEQWQAHLEFEKELKVDTLRKYMWLYYNADSNKEKEEYKSLINKYLWFWKNTILDFWTKSERTKQLETYEPFNSNHSAEFFDPSLMMGNWKFDIVIGNPPYIWEKWNKEIFQVIKKSIKWAKYYNAKMDIFYFFFHYWIDFLKNNWILSYITTNYFLTSDGALKLRKDFKERTNILNLIDFNEQKIFDTAKWQHNSITLLTKKNKESNNICNTNYVTVKSDYSSIINLKILNWDNNYCKTSEINQNNIYDWDNFYIRLWWVKGNDISNTILWKIKKSNKTLVEFADINSWCDITASKVTKKHIENINNRFIKDDWIFVLNKNEIFNLNLDFNEVKIFKDFIKSSNIFKYWFNLAETKLIYLDWSSKIDNYPNIKKHLEKFREIMDDQIIRYWEEFPWFALHRPRTQSIFEDWEKIIVPYRAKSNIFWYSDSPIYSSRDVFFIKEKNNLNIKFLLSVLNSKLIYFWLFNRWKRKGDMLELYYTPLSEIPIKEISKEEQKTFIELVDKILEITKQDFYDPKKPSKEQLDLESEIDNMVYELYGLSDEEIEVVEDSLK